MQTITKYFLIVITLLVFGCSKSEQKHDEIEHKIVTSNEQETFIKNFYRQYLDGLHSKPQWEPDWHNVFSKDLESKLIQNERLCKKLNRENMICKYDDDADMYLFTQFISDNLDFSTSKFKIVRIDDTNFEIGYLFSPETSESNYRKIKVKVIKENNGWRIDDMTPEDKESYDASNSMRTVLDLQNKNLPGEYAYFPTAFNALNIITNYSDRNKINNFFSSIVNLCDESNCIEQKNDSDELTNFLIKVNKKILDPETHQISMNFYEGLNIPKIENPTEHQQVELKGFTFEFIDQLWYITKIDLDKIQ